MKRITFLVLLFLNTAHGHLQFSHQDSRMAQGNMTDFLSSFCPDYDKKIISQNVASLFERIQKGNPTQAGFTMENFQLYDCLAQNVENNAEYTTNQNEASNLIASQWNEMFNPRRRRLSHQTKIKSYVYASVRMNRTGLTEKQEILLEGDKDDLTASTFGLQAGLGFEPLYKARIRINVDNAEFYAANEQNPDILIKENSINPTMFVDFYLVGSRNAAVKIGLSGHVGKRFPISTKNNTPPSTIYGFGFNINMTVPNSRVGIKFDMNKSFAKDNLSSTNVDIGLIYQLNYKK